jgi:hypothetical protein
MRRPHAVCLLKCWWCSSSSLTSHVERRSMPPGYIYRSLCCGISLSHFTHTYFYEIQMPTLCGVCWGRRCGQKLATGLCNGERASRSIGSQSRSDNEVGVQRYFLDHQWCSSPLLMTDVRLRMRRSSWTIYCFSFCCRISSLHFASTPY